MSQPSRKEEQFQLLHEINRVEGFDPAAIAADRHGVRDSIVGRMRRAGGEATIRHLARGTEIALSVPRSDILEETAPTGRTQ